MKTFNDYYRNHRNEQNEPQQPGPYGNETQQQAQQRSDWKQAEEGWGTLRKYLQTYFPQQAEAFFQEMRQVISKHGFNF
jgi:hypothetical protein